MTEYRPIVVGEDVEKKIDYATELSKKKTRLLNMDIVREMAKGVSQKEIVYRQQSRE